MLPEVIGGLLVKEVVGKLLPLGIPMTDANIETATKQVIAEQPAVRNQMNAEPVTQSRVVAGSTVGFIPAAGYIAWQLGTHGLDLSAYDWPVMFAMGAIVWGTAYAFYGRVASGLHPIRWFGWFR